MAIHTQVSPDQGTRQEPEANDRPWYTKKAVKIGGAAAGIVAAVGTGFGIGQAGNTAPTNTEQSYSATPNPGTGPEASSTASATPEATVTPEVTPTAAETAATQELPFNPDVVALMKTESVEDFAEYGRSKRVGYYLAEAYEQVYGISEYGSKLDQKFVNNVTVYEYNPFKKRTLKSNSKGQDVLNAYVFGELFAIAHEDPDEAEKYVSGIVDNPQSEAYKETVEVVRKYAGSKIAESMVRDALNQVDRFEHYSKTDAAGRESERMTIYAQGGMRYDFEFVPVPELATANLNGADNSETTGVWLLKERTVGKVTFEYPSEEE